MGILSKAQILQAVDLRRETVDVPEWGGSVLVRELTAAGRDQFEQGMLRTDADGRRLPDFANMRARLVSMCLIDEETGELMFEPAELDLLGKKSAAALSRVFEVCQRLNGMTGGDVEAAAKNSETGQSGASPSASPVTSE